MQIPITNLETGEISGTNPGTFSHLHEVAHLEFNKSNFGQNVQWICQMSEFFAVILSVFAWFHNPLKWLAAIMVIVMITAFTYEEMYCNYRAREFFNKQKV